MYTVKHINVLGYKRWHVQSKCLLDSLCALATSALRITHLSDWDGHSHSDLEDFWESPTSFEAANQWRACTEFSELDVCIGLVQLIDARHRTGRSAGLQRQTSDACCLVSGPATMPRST